MLSRRLLASILLTIVSLMVVHPVAAGKTWCRTDPILIVNDHVIDIQVASEFTMLLSANGPIQMVVTVPTNSDANVLFQDPGFGYGYKIEIVESDALDDDVLATVALYAPAVDGSLPVTMYASRVIALPFPTIWFGDASGTANDWIMLEIN